MDHTHDAIIVGAGPNGLAAAITLARAGRTVLVLEGQPTVGGGTRSAQLTLPGYLHDVCSAIHPLAVASPFFRSLPLAEHGLAWIRPPAALAHPLDGGSAVIVERSVEATGQQFGPDAGAYHRLLAPLVAGADRLLPQLLGPFRLPRHPLLLARFGWYAVRSAAALARHSWRGAPAQALLAGMAAHSMLPLDRPLTAGFGLLLTLLAHSAGWPVALGGSQHIADALAAHLRTLGGEIITGSWVRSLDELPPARCVLLDVTPRQLLSIAGSRLPAGYRCQLERYRYGPGIFKADYALDGPIPWHAADCARAACAHLGGTLEEIAAAEAAVWRGEHPERPFVLLAQPSLFDPARAPEGRHTAWAYCHVPSGSTVDMAERIEAQIERFAPGFRSRILARSTHNAVELEQANPNCVGGDINGGVQDWRQLFTRPVLSLVPYATPARGIYLCSSSTPPGGGVHGMCGYWAAQAALNTLRSTHYFPYNGPKAAQAR